MIVRECDGKELGLRTNEIDGNRMQRKRRRGRPERRKLDSMGTVLREKGLSRKEMFDRAAWRQISACTYLKQNSVQPINLLIVGGCNDVIT